jgi:hypothetical protein
MQLEVIRAVLAVVVLSLLSSVSEKNFIHDDLLIESSSSNRFPFQTSYSGSILQLDRQWRNVGPVSDSTYSLPETAGSGPPLPYRNFPHLARASTPVLSRPGFASQMPDASRDFKATIRCTTTANHHLQVWNAIGEQIYAYFGERSTASVVQKMNSTQAMIDVAFLVRMGTGIQKKNITASVQKSIKSYAWKQLSESGIPAPEDFIFNLNQCSAEESTILDANLGKKLAIRFRDQSEGKTGSSPAMANVASPPTGVVGRSFPVGGSLASACGGFQDQALSAAGHPTPLQFQSSCR